jgi:hypothetical protein
VNRLRNRLILIFLVATLAPLAATIWITTSLLEESIDTSSTIRLDTLRSRSAPAGSTTRQRRFAAQGARR